MGLVVTSFCYKLYVTVFNEYKIEKINEIKVKNFNLQKELFISENMETCDSLILEIYDIENSNFGIIDDFTISYFDNNGKVNLCEYKQELLPDIYKCHYWRIE